MHVYLLSINLFFGIALLSLFYNVTFYSVCLFLFTIPLHILPIKWLHGRVATQATAVQMDVGGLHGSLAHCLKVTSGSSHKVTTDGYDEVRPQLRDTRH